MISPRSRKPHRDVLILARLNHGVFERGDYSTIIVCRAIDVVSGFILPAPQQIRLLARENGRNFLPLRFCEITE